MSAQRPTLGKAAPPPEAGISGWRGRLAERGWSVVGPPPKSGDSQGGPRGRLSLGSSSFFIMGAVAVTSGLGFVYWVVAARLLTKVDVGTGSSAVSAVNLTSMIASLGLGMFLIHELPRSDDDAWSQLVTRTIALLLGVAAFAGLALVPILEVLSQQYDVVTAGFLGRGVILAFVVARTFGIVLDAICLAERRADFMFWRALSFAVLKLATLPLVIASPVPPAQGIVALWALSELTASIGVARSLLSRLTRRFRPTLRRQPHVKGQALRDIAIHWLTMLGGQLPQFALPVIVLVRGGAAMSASFYVGWTIGSSLFIVSSSVSQALLAEGRYEEAPLRVLLGRIGRILLAVQVPGIVLMVLVGPLFLPLFGPAYGADVAALIRVLALAAVVDGVTNVGVSVARLRGRLGAGAALNMGMSLATVVLAYVLVPVLGVTGGAWAYFMANAAGSSLVGLAWARRMGHVRRLALVGQS